jgi:hypothetical protein
MTGKRLAWCGLLGALALGCSGGNAGGLSSAGTRDSGPGSPEAGSGDGSSGASAASDSGPEGATFHYEGGGSSGGVATLVTSGKVDILIDIDNSASMGDKQDYLKAAIPDLIDGLVNPSCIDATTGAFVAQSVDGACASGVLEYAPVHDMHIAVITSSLGARGGDVCSPTSMAQAPFENVLAHNDDQAHLINRTLTYADGGASVTEGVLADPAPVPDDEFLYWYPGSTDGGAPGPGTPIVDSTRVEGDVGQLVGGAGVFGCGIESQLESWYRFLIQPDPYASISATGSPVQGTWTGVDATILAQRHDFLRPDSLVSIIDLSDENDSEIDVRSIGGQAVNWMSASFNPPRGTAACSNNPGDPACQSCAQGSNSSTDPNCVQQLLYTAINDWGYDMNLRHVHMKAKYGIDLQYPIERYVNGLGSTMVPDRTGEYPAGATSYEGTSNCTNPLFAAQLPDGSTTDEATLCNLPAGARPPGFVFYTHIGGVPASLLHYTPGDVTASTLTDADWIKILGNDPQNYDYSGIDPHMIESYQPRSGVAAPGASNDADPINGHDWVTNTSNGAPGLGAGGGGHVLAVDREYGCIFPLVDSTGTPAPRDCTLPQNASLCDCPHVNNSVTLQELPPICDQTTQTSQTGAKAYPTIRELLLAKLLGPQGIVASICPQHVTESAPGDPLWGYRPAIGILISRLAPVISHPIQ